MVRFYRLYISFVCLFLSFFSYGQVPVAVADNPPAILEDTPPTTFNVTDNDIEILAQIDPATVDLDLTQLGIQNSFSNGAGDWIVNSTGDVTYSPALNFNGTATTFYTVQNNLLIPVTSLPASISVDVTPVNDLPSISSILPQTIAENTATSALNFTIGDVETAVASLTVSGLSDNTGLVPSGNIVLGGSGANRNVTVTPLPGESGVANITVTVSDGDDDNSTSFDLTVTADDPPSISMIADQSTPVNTPTDPIAFTIGDLESQPSELTLSGSSSDNTLVPDANIVFGGGSGASRNVVITPATGQTGTTTITIDVSDGFETTSTSFVLTVTANTAPTISSILPQSTTENNATAPIAFTVGDAESSPATLTVSGTSSNTTLVPNANITFGGSGASRNVTITPAPGQNGTTIITITVSDGTDATQTTFELTVTNTSPTITAIGPQSTNESTPTAPIAFTIGDAESQPSALTVTGTSSNQTLVPDANIVFGGGSGASRNVTITPAAGLNGSVTITITVSDGINNTPTNFTLNVIAVDDPPTISAIANQTTSEDIPVLNIPFTVGDPDTPLGTLVVTATSGNLTLVPNANITLGGTGANRTISVSPASNQSGTATITVSVSDGENSASSAFTLTVSATNDAPTISSINDHSTQENTPTGAIAFTIGDADNLVATLTVSGSSSDQALVPDANISFGGSGANRTVTVTPLPAQSGTTTITVTVSDGTASTSTTFVLSVNDVNNPPTISSIADQTTAENTPTAPIPFTVGDAETPAANLTLTASTSNPSLIPVANITFGGSGANRTVTINPGASQSGSATVTITVNDGTSSASTTFNLIVDPVNDAPTITPIANQTTAENTPTNAIPFNVGDAETPAANLLVTATSSVTTLVPNGNIVIGGAGSDRTITVTPAPNESGSTIITVSVSDGNQVTSTSFTLTVSSVNDAPTITAITDQVTEEDAPTPALPFTLSDPDTPMSSLVVTGSSSNKTLVPDANIALFGDGISRTVTISPASNQTGSTTITLTVSDGTATASISFLLTVNPVNDAPTITAIPNQTTAENTPTAAIAFSVGDSETAAGSLTVTANSSNLVLVPVANINLGGSDEDRTIVITPASGQSGTTTITVTVSDGTASISTTFQLTVTSINDAPTITSIPNQTTNEDVTIGPISFTIGDEDSPFSSLTVTASSSDKDLVPDANITIANAGMTRTLTIKPAADQFGVTTITLTVSDGSASTQVTFTLTVVPVNDAPLITGQEELVTLEDTPLELKVTDFFITDPDNAPGDYSLVILPGNYTVSGSTITPLPKFVGELTVKVRVSDGKLLSNEFQAKVTVTDVNIVPVITGQNPNPIEISMNQPFDLDLTDAIIVDDPDGPSETLTVSPGENYSLAGAALTTIVPAFNYTGPLNVIVTVSDGIATSVPYTVKILVKQPSSEPLISGHIPYVIEEDSELTIQFSDLTVTDADDNYPLGFTLNITSGSNYTVMGNTVIPARNFNGTLTVPIRVNDGQLPSNVFEVRIVVTPVNDPPEITVLEDEIIAYEPGTGPIPITEAFECIDIDNDYLQLAEISIDSAYSPDNDELIYENDDPQIRGIYDPSRGMLSLIGYATIEQYITAIRSIKYNYRLTRESDGEQSPISTDPKTISITLNDGQTTSLTKQRTIELKTSVELSIPNAFTPNGDSGNDTWAVQPITKTDQFEKTIIRVYNKRGLLVYEAVGLDKEWDGTYNGELLPVDTYYYTIDLRLSFVNKTYRGAVTILR